MPKLIHHLGDALGDNPGERFDISNEKGLIIIVEIVGNIGQPFI
jgi:hypothetical protein